MMITAWKCIRIMLSANYNNEQMGKQGRCSVENKIGLVVMNTTLLRAGSGWAPRRNTLLFFAFCLATRA